ncbi:hypothetical protein [Prescottella agglutinans]|uniref:Uncharacterized protein n=1 Tax=Prescottella agglutinans TaxID=1644129 RepID=A0ABT6MK33_9NOCA|nr:hypothetical protein [Prescottella agglutinans]MDH6284575.1 hypothetical protein [Prescottella agglutinans]
MLSTLIHTAGAVIAFCFVITIVKTALAAPAWWLLMVLTAVMILPVNVLSWAGLPHWVAVMPMAAMLAIQVWSLFQLASVQWDRLQQLRQDRNGATTSAPASEGSADPMIAAVTPAAATVGWWEAPLVDQATPADDKPVDEPQPFDALTDRRGTEADGERSCEDDDLAFEDLIRRNFTVH